MAVAVLGGHLVEEVELLVDDGLGRRDKEGHGQVEGLGWCGARGLTQDPKPWKADCLRAVVRLYSSLLWWTWWAAHSTFTSGTPS